jgi:hypothetical protein
MMMLDEIENATNDYLHKWNEFIKARQNQDFFQNLKPTSVGWKTTDITEFNSMFLEIRDQCDQIHLGWVNDRWLASLHLKSTKLPSGIEIIKLMQRRPNSTDPVGLDHLDFYHESKEEIVQILASEPDLDASQESNNPLCHWHSIRFDDTEAKLRNDTVLNVCIAELMDANNHII